MNSPITDNRLLTVIVPAYNEGAAIVSSIRRISEILEICPINWEMIIVDDGSSDDTFAKLNQLAQTDPRLKALALSRNFGKESALLAGLDYANGDVVITIDADLQHPPQLIPEMLAKWQAGAQIVHAVKRSRNDETALKKSVVFAINKLISGLGGINTNNSSDFKLLDREIVDIIVEQLPERERFFRGLTSWLGFNEDYLYFDVDDRLEGESKWSVWALLELTITALTSFTSLPLRIVTILGFATLILGFFIASEALWSFINGQSVSGFATTIITLLLIGSFIMISLGIIGEYIAKIYEEVKARPHFLIKTSVGIDKKTKGRQ